MNHLIRQNDINEMIKYSLIDNICQMDTSIKKQGDKKSCLIVWFTQLIWLI